MSLSQPLKSFRASASLLVLLALMLSSNSAMGQGDYGKPSSCPIQTDWFKTSIPDPQKTAATMDFKSFCAFHTWSWNEFLWSIEEQHDITRFETLPDSGTDHQRII